jgi:hypothetical protein
VIQNKQPVNNQYPYSSFSLNRTATNHSYKNTKITPVLNAFHSFSANASLKQSNEVFNVSQAAEEFYKATLDMNFGTDLEVVKKVFKEVHQNNAQEAFDLAISKRAKADGHSIKNSIEVLEKKFNGFLKPFMQVPRKECMDILLHGKNLYRSNAMEYRLRGMWTAISDFLTVCKKHPVMSGLVISSVGYFGGTYPFLGAISGILIMAWASAVILMNELKAKKIPFMNAEKAEHYLQSGENIMAFLLTFSGVDGIFSGAKNGLSVFAKTTPKIQKSNFVNQLVMRSWNATISKLKHGEEVGLRFVIGLFDNVLLPFNSLSDQLNKSS